MKCYRARVHAIGIRQSPADFFSDVRRPCAVVDIRQKNDEFIAAETTSRVAGPHNRLQACGGSLQNTIAHRVPEAVVDLLELIDVEKQHHDLPSVSVGVRFRLLEAVLHSVWFGSPVSASWLDRWLEAASLIVSATSSDSSARLSFRNCSIR